MSDDDAELVSQAKRGDTDAYGKLVTRYQASVYATAFYYVGRYGAAEDISQDAFLAAYKSLARLKDPTRFGPWLKQITCRTAANWLRKHGDRLRIETPLPYKRTISIEDARQDPARASERGEDIERVRKAIDTLPERYRLPVVLRYLQELSYQEISDYTGDTRDEVRGLLERAGRQLRDILTESGQSDSGESSWHRARE